MIQIYSCDEGKGSDSTQTKIHDDQLSDSDFGDKTESKFEKNFAVLQKFLNGDAGDDVHLRLFSSSWVTRSRDFGFVESFDAMFEQILYTIRQMFETNLQIGEKNCSLKLMNLCA